MLNINVIDSIMGSGKTSFIIDHMNRTNTEAMFSGRPKQFLYVTPLLDEVDRVKDACPDLDFKDPAPVHGRKYYHLNQLISEGQNVATTHALFSLLTNTTYEKLASQGYTLVIDEVLTCVETFTGLKEADMDILFNQRFLYIDDAKKRLRWNHEAAGNYDGRFNAIRDLCDNGNLAVYGIKNGRPIVVLWQFPVEFLSCFDEVWVLTYLFEGSPMRAYLEAEGITFSLHAVAGSRAEGFALIDWWAHSEADKKASIRSLVSIYEGRGNDIGKRTERRHPLSSTWFKNAKAEELNQLKGSAVSFFKNVSKTPSGQNAWTTFQEARSSLKGPGFSHKDCFLPINIKATNAYADRTALAYLANKFSLPVIKNFFKDEGIELNDEVHALSEMIQVIWRTAIRNNEPIHLFIPSERMRNLFKLWLDTDNTSQFIKRLERQEGEE